LSTAICKAAVSGKQYWIGLAVGDRLRLAVGLAVGLSVGDRLGLAVGDRLGIAVRLSVGDRLGLAVGLTVTGLPLGLSDGVNVVGNLVI
jgi:hypothetical protein